MIWADRVAIALALLVAFGFGLAFVSSDAPQRMAALRVREAKFTAACEQQQAAPMTAAATAPLADAAPAPEATAEDATKAGPPSAASQVDASLDAAVNGGQSQPAAAEAAKPADGHGADVDAALDAAVDVGPSQSAAADVARPANEREPSSAADDRSPPRFCSDDKLQAALEKEEAEITVPTARGTLLNIGKAELFVVVPAWVGLRMFDIRTGGPERRLARNSYWQATQGTRRARRRKRRERMDRIEAGEQ